MASGASPPLPGIATASAAQATDAPISGAVSEAGDAVAPQITHIEAVGVLEATNYGAADETDDDGFNQDWDTASGASTSVATSILAHTFENGRRYHAYKRGIYPVPNDDLEQSREDMKHVQMLDLADGKLFLAPIDDHPQKILDIGTGTGTWAIEMGELYPGAAVLGVDLSPIQPSWVPPNVRFLVDDVEEDWLNGSNWDLVHFRNMAFCLRDVPRAVGQAFEHLRPGGWIEFQESLGNLMPSCDDGTLKEGDVLIKYYDMCRQACRAYGCDLDTTTRLGDVLQQAGFVNVTCVEKKMPIGTWPKDARMRLIGLYTKESMLISLTWNVFGKPFGRLGVDAVEAEVWAAGIRATLNDTSVHRYYTCHFWYAQKPT